ncbi:unnamed protein product [Camellia sinensis]|uniref:RING-type domain-containing protein n=1 Tax=Camellia sinensis TaxID=4442 RepID=A0A7J7G8H5_CAMSI|nr:hypothetical protein HYC85_024569 [Camellia sinensis]
MVVCKCRKATKLYCFVHKVPVCGECICFPEHQICVVRTYSEWVIDGEYDWPPKCCLCHAAIEEGTDPQTTRLGCLHIIHTSCLDSHIKGFPPHTAPAGYTCPACSTPIWPPKSIKDSGSRLHSKLKEAIMQSGLEKNLFGNHPVSLPATESCVPPPAFSSDPLMHVSTTGGSSSTVGKDTNDIVEIDFPSSVNPSLSNQHSNFTKSASPVGPGATTRKSAFQIDRQNSEISYYGDDEDGNQKKYTRRGTLRHKFLRSLIPFWSSALPTLPVTAPPRKDTTNDAPEGRVRHQRSSRMDPRKILLIIAIMACIATMGTLYYRLAQRGLGDDLPDDEQ